MSVYLGYLKIKLLDAIQYKMAAIAGVLTQIAWGGMYIMLFTTFLKNGTSTNMSINQMSTYIWLQQAFIMMFTISTGTIDKDILESVVSGNISMELIRPVKLYNIWHARNFGTKIGNTIIRCIPLIICCTVLPLGEYGISAPSSITNFILFAITLVLSMLLLLAYLMIMFGVLMTTVSSHGIRLAFSLTLEFFSGMVIPIAFMPDKIIQILKFTPFYYIQNVPFNIYTGYISGFDNIVQIILIQIIWLILLTIIGKSIIKKKTNKVVVQGG